MIIDFPQIIISVVSLIGASAGIIAFRNNKLHRKKIDVEIAEKIQAIYTKMATKLEQDIIKLQSRIEELEKSERMCLKLNKELSMEIGSLREKNKVLLKTQEALTITINDLNLKIYLHESQNRR